PGGTDRFHPRNGGVVLVYFGKRRPENRFHGNSGKPTATTSRPRNPFARKHCRLSKNPSRHHAWNAGGDKIFFAHQGDFGVKIGTLTQKFQETNKPRFPFKKSNFAICKIHQNPKKSSWESTREPRLWGLGSSK